MKELAVVMSDDLAFTETGERVPATDTVVVSLDGEEGELDLTAENAADLRGYLRRYLRAAHRPGAEPLLAGAGPRRAGGSPDPASVARNKRLRAFADERGLRAKEGPDRPAYETPAGKFYVPKWLREEFEAHEAGSSAPGMPGSAIPLNRTEVS